MTQLTVAELEQKIEMVNQDIKRLQQDGGHTKQIETMAMYKEYLSEQLKELKK